MQAVHRGLPQNWCRQGYGGMREPSVNSGLGVRNYDCLSVYADQTSCGDCAKIVAKHKQSAVSRAANLNAEDAEVAEDAEEIGSLDH